MNANKLHGRDQKTRKKCGWSGWSFIAPFLPKAKTRPEKVARKIFEGKMGKNVYMLHIYDALEMIEEAYKQGRSGI